MSERFREIEKEIMRMEEEKDKKSEKKLRGR